LEYLRKNSFHWRRKCDEELSNLTLKVYLKKPASASSIADDIWMIRVMMSSRLVSVVARNKI